MHATLLQQIYSFLPIRSCLYIGEYDGILALVAALILFTVFVYCFTIVSISLLQTSSAAVLSFSKLDLSLSRRCAKLTSSLVTVDS